MFSFTDEKFTELGMEKTEDNKVICQAHYEKEHGKLPQLKRAGTVYVKFISKNLTAS